MRILPDVLIAANLIQAVPVRQIFKDKQLNEFGCSSFAYIPYGGADFGEIVAAAVAASRRGYHCLISTDLAKARC